MIGFHRPPIKFPSCFSQPDGFAAGLGGALSLFLGVAIVMIFELIELFGDLFVDGISGDEETSKRKTNKNNR